MKSYRITDKTIALKRFGKNTIIYNVNNEVVINKNIKTILNENCSSQGTNLEGMKSCAKKILGIKYSVPIYLKEQQILLPIGGIRDKDCMYIMANKIMDYKNLKNKKIKIICINNHEFIVNLSKYRFEKLILYSIKLNNRINCQKDENFV